MFIMEGALGMRIEHGCVLMLLLMIITSLFWGTRQGMLQKLAYTRYCYNQLADNAIEDGLDAGCRHQGGSYPPIDEEVAWQAFWDSMYKGFDITADSAAGRHLAWCVKGMIFLQKDYFTVRIDGKSNQYPYEARIHGWVINCSLDGQMKACHQLTGERIFGSEEDIRRRLSMWEGYENGKNILAQYVVAGSVAPELFKIVQQSVGEERYSVDIPLIEEDNVHTIMGVGMLCFLQYDTYQVNGCAMERYALSGARVIGRPTPP